MRTNRWIVFSVLMVFCVATVAIAQEGQRGNRRGGGVGGGFGGFGGGFGGPGGFGGGGKLMLLGMEEVQKEIEIDDEQKASITKLGEEVRGDPNNRPNFRDMSQEEREKFFAEMRERVEKAEAKLADVLLPRQLERLEQLSIQQRGTGALADPKVQEKLSVTDEQKDKLKSLREEFDTKRNEMAQELFQGGGGDGGNRQDAFAKLGELRTEFEKKIVDVLTDDQKKQFEEMKGEKFDFPRPQFGGGRGGGGRGGRGGRGNRPETENPGNN